jgi:hypothetical protein
MNMSERIIIEMVEASSKLDIFLSNALTLKKIGINKSDIKQIQSYEYKYQLDDDKSKRCFQWKVFEGRYSFRGEMDCIDSNELINTLSMIRMSRYYRPSPIAGNINCAKILLFSEGNLYLFDLINQNPIIPLTIRDNSKLYNYIINNIKRDDIHGNGGAYILPLFTIKVVLKKYGDMSIPLIFTNLGILLQNMTLLFTNMGYKSCIHFGIKEYMLWKIENQEFFIPCILRVGK